MSDQSTGFSADSASPLPSRAHRLVADMLARADVRIGGTRPWDIHFIDSDVPERILARGTIGLGETYMDGAGEGERLEEFFHRVLRARLGQELKPLRLLYHSLRARLFNRQTSRRAWQVGQRHYDLGNDLYAAMLHPPMPYTCGFWQVADTLPDGREAKLQLICRKLRLQPGLRVLDIGCGWRSFMGYAAERY